MSSESSDVKDRVKAINEKGDSFSSKFKGLFVQTMTPHLLFMHTKIRQASAPPSEFIFYSDHITSKLIESALSLLEFEPVSITTPTGHVFQGCKSDTNVCGVSILRAGSSMEPALRKVLKSVPIGKILIQRNEDSIAKDAELFYTKLPADIQNRTVLLLDPMLATGGSAVTAIKSLKTKGVHESNIIFVNLVSCPEGIQRLLDLFPDLRIFTGMIDEGLNDQKFIVPGLGDFGDLYFGTR